MAFGKEQFLDQAINLALSVKHQSGDMHLTIVTDRGDYPLLDRVFDHIEPMNPERGDGLSQKLFIPHYSPYHETLFLDADTLLFRPALSLFKAFEGSVIGALGTVMRDGKWRYDISKARDWLNVDMIPKFNGGVHLFRKDAQTLSVLDTAHSYLEDYFSICEKLGYEDHNGKISQEVVLSWAMAKHRLTPVYDYDVRRQAGSVQMENHRVQMDVLQGKLLIEDDGAWYASSVGHFFTGLHEGFHYQREALKLRQVKLKRWPVFLSRAITEVLFGFIYFLYTAPATLLRRRPDRRKLRWMPCVPYNHLYGGIRSTLRKMNRKGVKGFRNRN